MSACFCFQAEDGIRGGTVTGVQTWALPIYDRVASEAADVVYHLLVGLASRGVSMRQVVAKLAARSGTSGQDRKSVVRERVESCEGAGIIKEKSEGADLPDRAAQGGEAFQPVCQRVFVFKQKTAYEVEL